ncbi:MAG: hypothetical protein LBK58_08490 [Prevotellaceae bacterium]|jgi:hypothetical protein|nr:hypothetical protein [Prevotellaceae bacterium]
MKRKKLFIFSAILAIATLAAINASVYTNRNELSDISLDNIEALAEEIDLSDCSPVRGICHKYGITYHNIAFE